jgi:transcriptional regulator with XRE-family HTH domain
MEMSPLHERLHAAVGSRTYRAIAEATDSNPETVRRYMQGQAPSAEFLAALCSALGLNAQWMLSGQGPMKASQIRTHALGQASAAELLHAMARTLEMLTQRVERLELFVTTMESRVRGAALLAARQSSESTTQDEQSRGMLPTPHNGVSHEQPHAEGVARAGTQAAAGRASIGPPAAATVVRARRIAQAIAARPRDDAR